MRTIFLKHIIHLGKTVLKKVWEQHNKNIPTPILQKKHIVHTQMLVDRQELLTLLPKHGVIAEIGVDRGVFSKEIVQVTTPKTLYLIDSWSSKRYHTGLRKQIEHNFSQQIQEKSVVIKQGNSIDIVRDFENKYFDWIYIDTDHSYHLTKKELEAYSLKVKDGGIIAGHDFTIGNWNGMVRYGVIEAVYEFCITHDWELLYITMNMKEMPSFAIRKIQL